MKSKIENVILKKYLSEHDSAEEYRKMKSEEYYIRNDELLCYNGESNTLIRVMLFTGMRVGEITGLHWADVDFEHSTLTVRYSLYRGKGQYKLGTPKTKSSARIISLPPQVMETLAEQMEWQEQRKQDVGRR